MSLPVAVGLLLAAVSGALVVFARDPGRQVFAIAANGLVLTVLFFILRSPDVALSEIAVGTALTPLLFLTTLTAIKTYRGDS